MALRISRNRLDELNAAKQQGQLKLAQAYQGLGGSDTALTPNYAANNPAPTASIPTLEKAVVSAYENLDTKPTAAELLSVRGFFQGNEQSNAQQQYAPLYNDIKNRETERKLNRIGQTDLAHLATGSAGMGMTTGQGLTPEMQAIGITRDDLIRLNEAQNREITERATRETAEKHPVASTLASFLTNPIMSTAGLARNASNYVTGNALETQIDPTQTIRETVSSQIESPVGRFAYNVGTSAGDMLTALALSGGLSGGGNAARILAAQLMGSEKANPVTNQAIERGLNRNQIVGEGIGSYATTALTEMIPLDNLINGSSIWRNILSEGIQEGAEDIADTALDELITYLGGNHDKSELSQNYNQYREAGYSTYDALMQTFNDYRMQVGLDMLAGGISGGALGAGTNIMSGRNPITGRIPTLNEDVNENVDNVNENVDALAEERDAVVEAIRNNASNAQELIDNFRDKLETVLDENPEQEQYVATLWEAIENANTETAPTENVVPRNSLQEEAATRNNDMTVLAEALAQAQTDQDNAVQAINNARDQILYSLRSGDTNAVNTANDFIDRLEYVAQNNPELRSLANEAAREVTDYVQMFGRRDIPVMSQSEAQNYIYQMEQAQAGNTNVENAINRARDQVIYAFDNRDPYAMQNAEDFLNRLESVAQSNPEMRSLANEAAREVIPYMQRMSDFYANSQEEAQSYLDSLPKLQREETQAQSIPTLQSVVDNARSLVDNFIQNGVFTRETLQRLQAELTELANANSESREQIAQLWNEAIQAVQNKAQQNKPTVRKRVVNEVVRTAENLRNKLDTFADDADASFIDRINEAEQRVVNEQTQEAVDAFNEVVADINEAMKGSEINISKRELTEDFKNIVKDITSDYKIRITDNMLKNELKLKTMKELTRSTYLGDREHRINFVKTGGTPIDAVYEEMYERSQGLLPAPNELHLPENMLLAVYNLIQQARTDKLDTETLTDWNRESGDKRPSDIAEFDTFLDELYDKAENDNLSGDDFLEATQRATQLGKKYADESDNLYRKLTELSDVYRQYRNNPKHVAEEQKQAQEAEKWLGDVADEAYNTLNMELGFFGNNANEDTNVDTESGREVHTGKYKVSKLSRRTIPNSGIVTDTEFEQNFRPEDKSYETVTHEATYNQAEKLIKDNGFKAETDKVLNSDLKDQWSAVDTDAAMMCFKKAVNDARHAEALGIDKSEAWRKSADLFKKIREHATIGGQAIEALKKWSMQTPEGMLAQAIAYANEAEGKQTADDNLLGQLDQAEKDNKITFSDEFIQEFLEKAHSLDDAENVTEAQKQRLNIELAHMVLSQVPKKFKNKFTAFWMNNLLASARTLLTRNVGGNAGKFALEQTATKAISGPIDKFASMLTGERTTTGLNREAFKAGWEGAKRSLANTTKGYWFSNAEPDAKFKDLIKDFDNLTILADPMLANREGVNEDNFLDLIRGNRSTYNATNLSEAKGLGKVKGGIENVLKVYDKLIKYGLAISDDPFYSFVYNQTLSELNQIRNDPKKYGGSFSQLTDAQFETFAKAAATAKGLEAVYQDNTKMSDGAMKIKEGIGKITEDMLGVDVLSSPLFPFVRTPMNVIRTNLEYNPLGIVKNVVNTIKEVNKNLQNGRKAFDKKSFDQVRFVRESSRNVVGSLLWIAGLALAHSGLLSGAYSDNDKEKQAQKEAGMQEYAFVNPINGNQTSIDWIPALGSDLISAAAFYDAYNRGDEGVGQALASGLKEGTKSMFEMSALQGLQRLTGSGYNSDKSVVNNAIQSLANTASSAAVPAFVRQIAQAMDPYKRDTYSGDDKEDFFAALQNNIPVLREQLQPRIGSNGEPLPQNPGRNTAQKWFDNLLNPATTTVPSALTDATRDEAVRLNQESGLRSGYQPVIARSDLNVDGNEATAEQLREYAQAANRGMHDAVEAVIDTDYYQSLSDEDKGRLLSNIYEYVRAAEKTNVLGLDPERLETAARIYYEDGQDGLLDYLTAGSMLSRMDSDNNELRREAALNAIDGMDADEINDLIDTYIDKRDSAVEEINGLMSDIYSGMSSEEARTLQQSIYADVRSAELYQALGMDTSNLDGAARAYLENGTQGVRDYYYARNALNEMGRANNPANRQSVMDAYNSGGDEAVQRMISDSQALQQLGFGTNMTNRYQHAQSYIPTLNPQSFYDLFTAIDTDDPEKESIKQSELLAYFNNHHVSEQDAMNYWLAFGPSDPWTSIPVLNSNGVYEAKKP